MKHERLPHSLYGTKKFKISTTPSWIPQKASVASILMKLNFSSLNINPLLVAIDSGQKLWNLSFEWHHGLVCGASVNFANQKG